METFERKEYKYYVPIQMMDSLRTQISDYMDYDPFCMKTGKFQSYTVRSIYLDTRRLLFYYEKVDGLLIRKKLRIRTYGSLNSTDSAFLEIKRKFDDTIFKERVRMPLVDAPLLLNGGKPRLVNGDTVFIEKAVLDKFIYLVKRLKLEPKALITYEREAFKGMDDQKLRVTFDLNVRSYPSPRIDDFYREIDLKTLKDTHFILEIKFLGRMPIWIRNIVREYKLRVQSISKYCNGLDKWPSPELQLDD